MLKTKTWILLLAVLLIVCTATALLLYAGAPKGTTVEILQDGVRIQTIDLSKVSAPYELTVQDPRGGFNKVLVEPGRVCIIEADCPDQVCVHRGWLRDSAAPIVCLPHRLVIQMIGDTELDAITK